MFDKIVFIYSQFSQISILSNILYIKQVLTRWYEHQHIRRKGVKTTKWSKCGIFICSCARRVLAINKSSPVTSSARTTFELKYFLNCFFKSSKLWIDLNYGLQLIPGIKTDKNTLVPNIWIIPFGLRLYWFGFNDSVLKSVFLEELSKWCRYDGGLSRSK